MPYTQYRLGKKPTQSLNKPETTDRDFANTIWVIVKGIPLPETYTEKDCKERIKRYWHRAMEIGNG